jgi:hypothetical protein
MSRPAPDLLADVVDRLFAHFEGRLTLPDVHAVVWRCCHELDIVSRPALPELVERLARQRLQDAVDAVR